MMPKPRADIAPNTIEFETLPLVKPTGFREYDARWWFGIPSSPKAPDLNLLGAEALGHLIGKHSSDDAIRVHHGELDVHRHLLVQRRLSQGNELPIEGLFQLVVLGVGGIAAQEAFGLFRACQQRGELDALGFPLGEGLIEV